MRNYNFLTPEEFDDFDEVIRLPGRLPDQDCPRCGNVFPGGLKRCTACGLEVARARVKPEAALPWPGYDKGLIVCKACNHASPDDLARKGKIQRCELCNKVVYIPSGLHSSYYEPNIERRKVASSKRQIPNLLYNILDILGAGFTKFRRSKAKWPILLIVLLVAGGLVAASILKGKDNVKVEPPSPARIYYQDVLPLRGAVTQAIQNFRLTAGDVPTKESFQNWRNPNNRERFIRACDETMKVIETTINQLRTMKDEGRVPPEALEHQQKMLEMLYARQMYYARLKDGLNNNDQAYWNTAFDLKDKMSDTFSSENAALENLRDLVLNSKNASK